MTIPEILLSCSIAVWLFPPLKHRNTEYFLYFLILALSDPVKLILLKTIHTPNHVFSIMFGILLVAVLLKKTNKRIVFLILSLVLPPAMFLLNAPPCFLYFYYNNFVLYSAFNSFNSFYSKFNQQKGC